MNLRLLSLATAFVASFASAQLSLTTTLVGGNGQNGAMFDITALSPVVITSFDSSFFAAATTGMAVYTKTGSHATFETNAAAWTLVGTTTGVVVPAGSPTTVAIPIPVNVNIAGGATQAFYVTSTTGATVAYTNGGVVGTTYAADSFIQFKTGVGKQYPFGATFTPRNWNGIIRYAQASSTPEYQVNQSGSTLDVNGVQGNTFVAASVSPCVNETFTVNSGSTSGLAWDVLLSSIALVPASQGALATTSGQLVNINLAAFNFFLGGAFTNTYAPFSLPSSFPVPVDIYLQQANIDVSNPDFISLSQPNAIHVIGSGTAPMPTTDDSFTTVNLAGPPFCGPGAIPFFGTNFTQMQVVSNGRVMFGTASTSFTPSTAAGITDSPWVGAWGDLNPGTVGSGQITATQPAANIVRVDYNGVFLFGNATPFTFGLQFDGGTGVVSLDNYNPGIAATNFMLGISRGAGLATDQGQAVYSTGVLTPAPALNGMIYKLGAANAMFPVGMTRIDFVPNAGVYDWIGS